MIITNKKNLPEGIVEAVKNDYYSKGDAKFSVTGLLQPPQARRLMAIHFDQLTTDASDEIWKLFGSAVHNILERAQGKHKTTGADLKLAKVSGAILGMHDTGRWSFQKLSDILNDEERDMEVDHIVTEERLYLTVGDIRISGATDWYNKLLKKVEDYKVTTAYKVTKGDRSDWEAQLNVYALLLINAGYPVEELQINAILKDWSRREYMKWSKGDNYYPDCPVEKVNIPLWKPMDTLKWLIAKIEDQMQVEEITDPVDIAEVRPCTLEEKWQKPATYALMKHGGKRASSVFDTFAEANGASLAKGKEYFVETRLGYAIRCEEYCIVKDFCHQYKAGNINVVTDEDLKVQDLKNLEELIPANEETKEIDLNKFAEVVKEVKEKEVIPIEPEQIKADESDKQDLSGLDDLINKL